MQGEIHKEKLDEALMKQQAINEGQKIIAEGLNTKEHQAIKEAHPSQY